MATLAIALLLLQFCLFLPQAAGSAPGPTDDQGDIIILANEHSPLSRQIAERYADSRQLPRHNIISLPLPLEETIDWQTFVEQLHNPLLDALLEKGALRVTSSGPDWIDKFGRKCFGKTTHHVRFLVICAEVPLRIESSDTLLETMDIERFSPPFRRMEASVDSELSLLVAPSNPVVGYVVNPCFSESDLDSAAQSRIIKVARLDGPGDSGLQLVQQALLAEKRGLQGRAYIDMHNGREGGYQIGDHWLELVTSRIDEMGFSMSVNGIPDLFPVTDRFDAPVLYFGWHQPDVQGPFLLPGFRMPPGAIAIHTHSLSAETLRDQEKRWCGPLVQRGATATVGYVHEPYLETTLRPHLLIRALDSGMNWGDAAYAALPVLGWQAVIIGDPLYQPFQVLLGEQLKRYHKDEVSLPAYTSNPLPKEAGAHAKVDVSAGDEEISGTDRYHQYSHVRKMRLLRKNGDLLAAISHGESAARHLPGTALSFELAKACRSMGWNQRAVNHLAYFQQARLQFAPDEWALAIEAADLLARLDEPHMALSIYEKVLRIEALPEPLRLLAERGQRRVTPKAMRRPREVTFPMY